MSQPIKPGSPATDRPWSVNLQSDERETLHFRKGHRREAAQFAYQSALSVAGEKANTLRGKMSAWISGVKAFFSRRVSIVPAELTEGRSVLMEKVNQMQSKAICDRKVTLQEGQPHNYLRSRGQASTLSRSLEVCVWPNNRKGAVGHTAVAAHNGMAAEDQAKKSYLGWRPKEINQLSTDYYQDKQRQTGPLSGTMLERNLQVQAKQERGELLDLDDDAALEHAPAVNEKKPALRDGDIKAFEPDRWETSAQKVWLPAAGLNGDKTKSDQKPVLFGLYAPGMERCMEAIKQQPDTVAGKTSEAVTMEVLKAGGVQLFSRSYMANASRSPEAMYDFTSQLQVELDSLNSRHSQLKESWVKVKTEHPETCQLESGTIMNLDLQGIAGQHKALCQAHPEELGAESLKVAEQLRYLAALDKSLGAQKGARTYGELAPVARKLVNELYAIKEQGKALTEVQQQAMNYAMAALDIVENRVIAVTSQ